MAAGGADMALELEARPGRALARGASKAAPADGALAAAPAGAPRASAAALGAAAGLPNMAIRRPLGLLAEVSAAALSRGPRAAASVAGGGALAAAPLAPEGSADSPSAPSEDTAIPTPRAAGETAAKPRRPHLAGPRAKRKATRRPHKQLPRAKREEPGREVERVDSS
eukprot:9503999-Pyramimonas_sp.AAC.2